VLKLMTNKAEWNGNATSLMTELADIAAQEQIDTKSPLWPKLPNAMSRRLNEVKPNLAQRGYIVENQNGGSRIITITDTSIPRGSLQPSQHRNPAEPSTASGGDDCNNGDDLPTMSQPTLPPSNTPKISSDFFPDFDLPLTER
jgi:hypothetical protein